MQTDYNENWVNDLLKQQDLSPAELAKEIKKPRQSVIQWQSGTLPTIPAMLAVINRFNVSPDYFFINILPNSEV